ncbi:MAG TPA: hypothetical protein VK281_04240 [Xanthobacteraceae bacterium]|nr:hypothetical protein [Xanthobacteraceae bacterium]
MRPSDSLRRVARDRARRTAVVRLEHAQLRVVKPLPDAKPVAAGVDDNARPDRDRAAPAAVVAVVALVIATAAAIGAIIGPTGSNALQEVLRIAGLGGEPVIETVQRKQAAAISQLDVTLQALHAAVAGLSGHADFAGHREEAMTRRIDRIDDDLGALRISLNDLRAAQSAAEDSWRKPVAQLTAAVTRAHTEIVGLRASLDEAGPVRRPDLAAIGERIDRLEQAMIQHNLLGSIRGSIQDARQPPVTRDSAAIATNGHVINLTPAAQ